MACLCLRKTSDLSIALTARQQEMVGSDGILVLVVALVNEPSEPTENEA